MLILPFITHIKEGRKEKKKIVEKRNLLKCFIHEKKNNSCIFALILRASIIFTAVHTHSHTLEN
jgi:hypothetical protein